MIEIDLSGLTPVDVEDPDRFEALVLDSADNRQWLSHPAAAEEWRDSLSELKERVRKRNAEIVAEQAERDALVEQQIQTQKEDEDRKEKYRASLRAAHQDALAELFEFTSGAGVGKELQRMLDRDEPKAESLLARVSNERARPQLQYWDQHAWGYKAHPLLWQVAAYLQFVEGKPSGHTFSQPDLARWVRETYGVRDPIWRLFQVQYQCKIEARKRGHRQRMSWAWFLTHEENRRIPDFWEPINRLIGGLRLVGVVANDERQFGRIVVL